MRCHEIDLLLKAQFYGDVSLIAIKTCRTSCFGYQRDAAKTIDPSNIGAPTPM